MVSACCSPGAARSSKFTQVTRSTRRRLSGTGTEPPLTTSWLTFRSRKLPRMVPQPSGATTSPTRSTDGVQGRNKNSITRRNNLDGAALIHGSSPLMVRNPSWAGSDQAWVLRRKQVLGPCRRIREGQRRLLDLSVDRGQPAGVLTEMLLPGRDAEQLQKAVRSVAVSIQLPARRPGSASRKAKLIHRLQEGRLPLRRDRVLDCDHDGSGIRLRVEGQPGLRPVDGRLRVEMPGLRHPPDHSNGYACQHQGGRDEERRLQSDALRDQSPDQRSDRHRTGEGHHVDSKASGADPNRQKQLQLGIQG